MLYLIYFDDRLFQIGGYEAMSLEDASESFVALGLSGPKDGERGVLSKIH